MFCLNYTEILGIIVVLLILTNGVHAADYESVYPIAYSDTTVKETSRANASYDGSLTFNPALLLTGDWVDRQWLSNANTNQRLHVDLNQGRIIKRVYYENGHNSGASTDKGARNFTFWGTNSATAFAETTYGTDTDWVQLTTSISALEQHVAADTNDPKYFTVTNSTSYRYYGFKFADNYGGADYLGVRRIVLQTQVSGLTANFSSVIDKVNQELELTDTSTTTDSNIVDWNWLIDGTKVSDDQNYTKTGITAFTDYNVCLQIKDDLNFTSQLCSNINSGRFVGRITIKTYDENSSLALTGVTINFDGNNYTSQMDINTTLTNTTSVSTLLTLSKTGYSTRYYQTDMNKFTDININFALLPDTLDSDIPFKVYQTDETTLFDNTYVEILDKDTNYTIGKLKTNSSGEITFNTKADDQNYWALVNNGQYIYAPVALTILYPKDEETLAQIDGNWRIDITQNLYASYTNLNASKIIYLLPNTSLPFNIQIQDMNGNYFSRTYAKQYLGNPLTDTLQPYLVSTTTGLLSTINTVDVATLLPVSSITIKIYKFISGSGRTYVEQVITDSKGQALVLLVLNNAYSFEIYQNDSLLRTDDITASSSTITLKIPSTITINKDRNYFTLTTNFTPTRNKLLTSDTSLTQTINLTNYGIDSTTISSLKIWITNTDQNGISGNDKNVVSKTIVSPAKIYVNSFTLNSTLRTIDGNSYDSNGTLTVYVQITLSTGEVSLYSITYGTPSTRSLTQGFSIDIRPFFGCSGGSDEPCGMLILAALFLSIILTIAVAIETGFMSMEGMGIIFLVMAGIFTYLSWIPVILYGLMVILMVVLGIAIGGNKL